MELGELFLIGLIMDVVIGFILRRYFPRLRQALVSAAILGVISSLLLIYYHYLFKVQAGTATWNDLENSILAVYGVLFVYAFGGSFLGVGLGSIKKGSSQDYSSYD